MAHDFHDAIVDIKAVHCAKASGEKLAGSAGAEAGRQAHDDNVGLFHVFAQVIEARKIRNSPQVVGGCAN